jgi:hypothetical protein
VPPAVKRIFKPDLRLIVGRGQSRFARRIPLALPFIISVIALPAMDWFEKWLISVIALPAMGWFEKWLWYNVWHGRGRRPAALVLGLYFYSEALNSALVIGLLSIVLPLLKNEWVGLDEGRPAKARSRAGEARRSEPLTAPCGRRQSSKA